MALRRLRRIRLHLPLAVAALALAHPEARSAPWGIALVGVAEALRWWAAGVLIKGGGLCVWGPYQYVRHPLYLGTVTGAVGLCLLTNSPWVWGIVLPAFLQVYAWQIREEERLLAEAYGDAYTAWARRVPMLLPRLHPARPAAVRRWTRSRAFANREQFHALVTVVLVGLFLLKPALLGAR